MEHPERKPNRLIEYDYRTNGAYFVTICTQDRKKILSSIVGDGFPVPKPYGMMAEEFIRQIPLKYPSVTVDNYVIMPDHIHLLLRFDRTFGTSDRASASKQRGHPRRLSAALSLPQERAAEHQRIGESERHQPHHRLQIQKPFGEIKKRREQTQMLPAFLFH